MSNNDCEICQECDEARRLYGEAVKAAIFALFNDTEESQAEAERTSNAFVDFLSAHPHIKLDVGPQEV